DAGVMDIFVIRIAGNVCGTDEIWSIEYGLGNVHTPVFLMLGHTQCGAVTVVTHNVQGKDSALESNLPPFADNIIPAVKRAMEAHEDVHGDEIIQYAIEENMWQGIENLFMNSPETRSLVHAGKVKVVAAVYDVGTGRARWFPSKKVDEILRRVEASPDRETERRG
ncbi:MAG: carbonic anhydrase, partial [Acidobacteria bacterium]